eukprot:scaffold3765_cov122-Isochrysis_galbana.AAC.12
MERIELPCKLSRGSSSTGKPCAQVNSNALSISVALAHCLITGGMLSAAVQASSYESTDVGSAHCCAKRSSGRVKLARSTASASE